MGQTSCCSKTGKLTQLDHLGKELTICINSTELSKLEYLISDLKSYYIDINSDLIDIAKAKINCLTYSFFIGNAKVFKFLLDKGADFSVFQQTLSGLKIDAFYFICDQGFIDLLSLFLTYINKEPDRDVLPEDLSHTLSFGENEISGKKVTKSYTPVQRACEKGHIAIVVAIYRHFQSKCHIPAMFDLERPSDRRGETCALIACRVGNFAMIKALHKVCRADFTKLNFYRENALMICVSAYKTEKSKRYLECISYLIESVKVDVSYMHEELLLLCEDSYLVTYFEAKLKVKGINSTKQDLEEQYKIAKNSQIRTHEGQICNTDSILREITPGNSSSPSVISSISFKSSKIEMKNSFFSQHSEI